ncbi:MAG: AraC family transcriptional regulator, partial [Bacillota bacterium]
MANKLKSIFTSDLVQIDHYKCGEEPHSKSDIEIIETYEISISRRGYFFLKVRNTQYDIYTEYLMLGNKDMEYSVSHGKHVDDESTIFRIKRELLEEVRSYYWHKDFKIQSLPDKKDEIIFPLPALKSNPGFDSTHLLILNSISEAQHKNTLLKIELLALSLIEDVFREIYSNGPEAENPPKFKSIHLDTIELAKSFIAQNFKRDISLSEIASSSFLTPFHFTRIFKKYTGLSP